MCTVVSQANPTLPTSAGPLVGKRPPESPYSTHLHLLFNPGWWEKSGARQMSVFRLSGLLVQVEVGMGSDAASGPSSVDHCEDSGLHGRVEVGPGGCHVCEFRRGGRGLLTGLRSRLRFGELN